MPVKNCRICSSPMEAFMSFGKMPMANAFLKPADITREEFFELAPAFCETCAMFQLIEQPAREKMFHADYPFLTGTSSRMREHFGDLARRIFGRELTASDPFVVELGSNDGTFLENFSKRKVRHLGIEPAQNVARLAQARGVRTLPAFFDSELARAIVNENGRADLIYAANVMCHIPDLHSVLEGVKLLLKPAGVFIFEDPYLGDVLEKISYDQIYDEHVFLFSVTSIRYLAKLHGLEVVDVESLETHGGSMRYSVALKGKHAVSPKVEERSALEKMRGINSRAAYDVFDSRCARSKRDLVDLLDRLKREGKRVAGYAATSKSTTVLNYCGITQDLLECIFDTTPAKHGLLSPGAHIPVVPHDTFQTWYPDYALLFGWNHRAEIFAKEEEFMHAGGKWIVYVPNVQILEASHTLVKGIPC